MPTPVPLLETLNRFSIVIVTGGSSGIGCSIIKAILRLSTNVRMCNISRSKPEIFLGDNGVHLSTDLTDKDAVDQVTGQLVSIIDTAPEGELLLVNNSGFGDYGKVHQLDIDKQLEMIDLNIRAIVDLTGRLMPQLEKRGGVVMNIASTAGFQPTPFLATYGASKAFVLNWSLALNEDLRETKVRAMAVCPGPTRSNFFKRAGFEIPPMQAKSMNQSLDMTSDEVAELALKGIEKGKSLVVTGWKNTCIAFFGSRTPRVLVTRIGGYILRKLRLEQHSSAK